VPWEFAGAVRNLARVRGKCRECLHDTRNLEEFRTMRVIGLAGWSGAGKTTLIVKLIPYLHERGIVVSTLKHAHHAFDVDQPGKDSYLHREAGAREVLVASSRRFALMHELRGAKEPDLAELLRRMSPADLILVEGYKREAHAKIEVHRAADAKPFLYPEDPTIAAVATDAADCVPLLHLPHAHLDDIAAIASLILALAQPIEETVARLAKA
jgi:molybdopterin-guanine dinucleotide biosynthesis adapter protein